MDREDERDEVTAPNRTGVPMKKASAPSVRQASVSTLANIIFDIGWEVIEGEGRR